MTNTRDRSFAHWESSRRCNAGALLLFGMLTLACGGGVKANSTGPGQNPDILRVDADGDVVDGRGNRVSLRGSTFFNGIHWNDGALAGEAPEEDHARRDYRRLVEMNMNSAIFTLSYHWFEQESSPFGSAEAALEWMDQNVRWAEEYGIYLVLDLQDYPGGQWSNCGRDQFFADADSRERVFSLWEELATRYADEPSIAGYSVLDSPSPPRLEDWQFLAEELVSRIRAVDPQHIIWIGQVMALNCTWDQPAATTFPPVEGMNNVGYFRSFNWPFPYTYQLLENESPTDGGSYPDDSDITITDWSKMRYLAAADDSTPPAELLALPPAPDDEAWVQKHYTYTVSDPDYELGHITLVSSYNEGTAFFDDLVVNEYRPGEDDGELEFVRTVFQIDFEDQLATPTFYLWEGDDEGEWGEDQKTAIKGTAPGHDDASEVSVTIANSTGIANLGIREFAVTMGHTYEVMGWMRGEGTAERASALIQLDFWDYSGPPAWRNRAALEQILGESFDLAEERGVPLLVETDLGWPALAEEKGGQQWLSDVLDIVRDHGGHYAYGCYNWDTCGIYRGASGLPTDADGDQVLIDLLTAKGAEVSED